MTDHLGDPQIFNYKWHSVLCHCCGQSVINKAMLSHKAVDNDYANLVVGDLDSRHDKTAHDGVS